MNERYGLPFHGRQRWGRRPTATPRQSGRNRATFEVALGRQPGYAQITVEFAAGRLPWQGLP
eukprot:934782-Lingulodinium_polyedra.AAC.1